MIFKSEKSKFLYSFVIILLISSNLKISAQKPVMGWSSWNHFRIHINEDIIKAQADAMATNGMKEAGYRYINIDDGYFGGRDSLGNLISHPGKFPSGMKSLATYIHSKGLKAGIYTDAGKNTCGSHWDKDPFGIDVGLFGHEEADLKQLLINWNYDFIKVDWCGGKWLKLDRERAYTDIGKLIRKTKPGVVYNVCCWEFPGEWVNKVADSWRISGDITNRFASILKIIDKTTELYKYSSPGHYNDMDMLQVGRGMSYEEDKAHFSMWCMLNSPLLAGNDLRTISAETLNMLCDTEIIALNQDELGYQARKIRNSKGVDIWLKKLHANNSGKIAIALLNRSKRAKSIEFPLSELGIDASKGYAVRDLWDKKDYPVSQEKKLKFKVKGHGIVVLKIERYGF
jgi:hypothetical protein